MASTKDKTVLTVLVINRELMDTRAEIQEYEEYIGYIEQVQNKSVKQFEMLADAKNTLRALRAEISDLKELRKSEFDGANFTSADFGHESENYADAKWYGAFTDLSEGIRNQYPSDRIAMADGKTQAQKYFALDNEFIRYANDELYKAYQEKTKETPEWSADEIANFEKSMGMSIEEWRATARGIWAA